MKTIVVANRKGGVGKTTIAVNLSAALGRLGNSVLVIDMDSQRGNATRSLGAAGIEAHLSIGAVIADNKPIDDVIIPTGIYNVFLAPAHTDMTSLPKYLATELAADVRLRRALSRMKRQFDFAVIDCGPSLDILTVNALVAADYILVPHIPEPLSLEGVIDLMRTVEQVQTYLHPELKWGAIVINRPNPLPTRVGRNILQETRDAIAAHNLPIRVSSTVIPQNVRVQEAQRAGLSVFDIDPDCPSARAFVNLAEEVLVW